MNGNKKAQLLEVSKRLKKSFKGLDYIIDDIITKIEVWWCHPEFLTRPTIINLWGMTGSGKTDLVRQLAANLGMIDHFCNIDVDNSKIDPYVSITSPFSDFSILGRLYNNRITPSVPAILLIDEIQKHRSIRLDGMDSSKDRYDDMWKLLSDGRLTDDQSRIRFLQRTVDNLSNYVQTMMKESFKQPEQPVGMALLPGMTPELLATLRGEPLPTSKPAKFNFDIERYLNTIGFDDGDVEYMKTLKMMTETPDEYMRDMAFMGDDCTPAKMFRSLDNLALLRFLQTKLEEVKDQSGNGDPDRFVYSKMLIFISGNLDGLYDPKGDVYKLSTTELYEQTLKITIGDVKNELLKMFRPEQVSRFGNNHIIYRSHTDQTFDDIIADEVSKIEHKIASKHGIDISIDRADVIKRVREIGIFPSQGVRPVFSTTSAVVGEIIPQLLIEAQEKGLKVVKQHVE